jgi:hypothetical protein
MLVGAGETIMTIRHDRAISDSSQQLPSSEREPIAIIGIGCRFPGGANSPEEFWTLLRSGIDAITEVPQDRWSLEAFYACHALTLQTYPDRLCLYSAVAAIVI